MDKISMLVGRQAFSARVFYNGQFCGVNEFREDGRAGQLHIVRQGPVIIRHDDNTSLEVDVPSIVFYPRGSNHRLTVPDGTRASLLCATTSFHGGGQNLLARTLPDYLLVPVSQAPVLGQTLELIFSETAQAQGGEELILDRLCDVLVVQLLRHHLHAGRLSTGTLAGLADVRLSRALSAIHGAPKKPWRLESLASLCGMSRSKFAEYFLSVVGVTPGEYLTRWRISTAQDMLLKGRPVKIVSMEVGYSSQSAFTRAFTERIGMSPRAWMSRGEAGTESAPPELM